MRVEHIYTVTYYVCVLNTGQQLLGYIRFWTFTRSYLLLLNFLFLDGQYRMVRIVVSDLECGLSEGK
jgi:hypothetical protein